MKYIVTDQPARIASGVLILTDEQASRRMHNLKSLGKKRYEIFKPVVFKIGEEIGYEGDLPKGMAINLTAKSEADAAAKKAAEAAAKAQAKADKDAAEVAAQARENVTADATAAWKQSKDLRDFHSDDFEAYLAKVLREAGL